MFLAVRDMERRPVEFSLAFDSGHFPMPDEELRQLSPLSVSGRATWTESISEIRLQGRLAVAVETSCERCLEPAHFDLDRDFDLQYRQDDGEETAGGEHTFEAEDADVAFFEGNGIELDEVIREQLLLAIPMQRLCREDCRGLCPVCGQNRNTGVCECRAAAVDDRWLALRGVSGRGPVAPADR